MNVAATRPALENLYLGRIEPQHTFDLEVQVLTGTTGHGPATGFGSIGSAIHAARVASTGGRSPAVGVFEVDGRYHLQSLVGRMREVEPGGSWLGPWDRPLDLLEGNGGAADWPFRPYRKGELAGGLRAIVDGADYLATTRPRRG